MSSAMLEMNSAVLDAVHNDLKDWGADKGRDSTYNCEYLFRALLVKWMEGLSFRNTIIRIADTTILCNFMRINSGMVMNFMVLDTAFKYISVSTWTKTNTFLEQWTKKEKSIAGKYLCFDSIVCESKIHYLIGAHLLGVVHR